MLTVSNLYSNMHMRFCCKQFLELGKKHTSTVATSVLSDHYVTGSKLPPLKPGVLRIYGMEYCPYVQRVLLVLETKGIPYETINCNLLSKPEWLFEKNTLGKVPILEQDEKLLVESLIISDYLDEAYPENKLQSSDPYHKAKDRMLVETKTRKFYQVIKFAHQSEDANKSLREFQETAAFWEEELRKRGTPYFGGDNSRMLDFMIWPWFERADALSTIHPEVLPQAQFAAINGWIKRMKSQKAVKATLLPNEKHLAFFKEVLPQILKK